MPSKPKVTAGPKCYGKTKGGRLIVIRFFVAQIKNAIIPYQNLVPKNVLNNWWVLDFDEKLGPAKGTPKFGYSDKEEAIRVAREYRDTYGAWSRSKF